MPLQHLLSWKREWDAACEEYEAAFPGFKANWEANKARESHPDFYSRMAAKGQWDEAALPTLPDHRSADADEKRLAARRYVSGVSLGVAGSCGKRRGLPPTPPSPCMPLQNLLSRKKEWDGKCEEYEAAFPGFRANWEARKRGI